MSTPLAVRAPAKINLSLEVLGRRPDGYHEISTVLQTVDLSDELTLEPAEEIALECSATDLAGPDNLVLRAAQELRRRFPGEVGARIRLMKRIPVAAGLGGGSSDAAAALRALRRLWQIPCSDAELRAIAANLGSDVPFFLQGGTAWATGRGEQLEELPTPALWVLLLPHDQTLTDKTRRLYSALSVTDFGSGEATGALVDQIRVGQPVFPEMLVNSFTEAALHAFPGLRQRYERVHAILGMKPHLSGSGPTLFLTFVEPEEASRAYETIEAEGGLTALLTWTTRQA